jgi:uncharacterized protein YndB with AHSA1/START domain
MRRSRRASLSGRVEAVVDAPVESVWHVVSDVTRTGEWSHECLHVEWLDGATKAEPGVRFRGANRSLWWRWHRTCEVLHVEPNRSISWHTIATRLFVDSTDWRISLEPCGSGTRIVEEFQVTKCPRWWEWLVVHVNSPHIDRSVKLEEDLRRIGEVAAVERPSGAS